MDEYTYEDFDIVPSQDLVSSTLQHDTDDITQPAKRVKTTHGDEESLNQPDTQLSQLLPDGLRKIPGPAGSLPPMHVTSVPSFPSKALVLASQPDGNLQHDGLFMQSKLHKKNSKVNGTQDDYSSDFTRGPWLVMLQHSELPPFGTTPSLLKYNIEYILENRRVKKIPRLVALVKAVVPTDADLRVTLRDPTGEIEGALQRKAMELHPSIISGAVIVLEQVSVFCPSPVSHYLNIVSKNIVHVYTPSSSELTAAKVEFKRIATGYSPKSIYSPDPPPDPSPKKPKPPPPARNKQLPAPSPAKPKSSVWKPSGPSRNSPQAQRQAKKTVVPNPPSSQSAHPDLPTSGSHNIAEFLVQKPTTTSPRKENPPTLPVSPIKQHPYAPDNIDTHLQTESSQPAGPTSTQPNNQPNYHTTAGAPNPPPPNAKRPNFFQNLYANMANATGNNPPANSPIPSTPSNNSSNISSNNPSNNTNSNNPTNNSTNHTPSTQPPPHQAPNQPQNQPNHQPLNNQPPSPQPPNNQPPNNQPNYQTQNYQDNQAQNHPPPNNAQVSQNYQNGQQHNYSNNTSFQNRYQGNNYTNNQSNNQNNQNTQNFSNQYQQNNPQQRNQSNQENLQNQQYSNGRIPQKLLGPPKPLPQFSAQSQSTLRNGNSKGNDNMSNFSRDLSGGRKLDALATPTFQTTTSFPPGPKSSNPPISNSSISNPSSSYSASNSSSYNSQTNAANSDSSGLNNSLDDYDLLDCEL